MDHRELIRQLGTALPMMGAKDLVALPNALAFRIGRNSKGVNKVVITLDPDDTYSIQVLAVRKQTVTIKGRSDGVYVDSLHNILESLTGLYTRF